MGCLQLVHLVILAFADICLLITCEGPVSESDFFTWEALICGPKDTPFVSYLGVGNE